MISRLKWYLKQILPLTYWTECERIQGDKNFRVFIIWKMWLGRSYDVTEIYVPN